MPFTLTMPKLSPTMEFGTIAKWHKKEGEQVEPGDLLFEVSTDKATVEHNALDGGWLRKILVPNGGEAAVNDPIAIFTDTKDEKFTELPSRPKSKTPEEGSLQSTASIQKTQEVEKSSDIDKSSLMQPAFTPEPPLKHYVFEYPFEALEKLVKASPLAKKLAKEKGLDLTTVKGTGPGGRIVKEDLEMAQKSGTAVFGGRDLPNEKPGSYEEESLNPMRKVISQRLQEAKTFIPHFYVTQAINAEPLLEIKQQLQAMGVVVSINDCIIRACALSLRQHPNINAGFNSVNQSIIHFKTIDIAVAVGLKDGLITPIIRHADYKNLGEISVEIRALAKKAREGKLALEQFKGGSFTISNLGMYGISEFQAILNPPQAAILAVAGIQEVPVIKQKEIVPGKVMNITLSADHRVIDGVAASEFIKTVQKTLENPAILLV